nr:MAG TPA: transposase [Bacteriophage sp.]DAT92295.1 MAG TPA: transposase [Caudoviricetes sp.]
MPRVPRIRSGSFFSVMPTILERYPRSVYLPNSSVTL